MNVVCIKPVYSKTFEGDRCKNVEADERVVYEASITLDECKASGDAVVSIGVNGHRDVVAVYITPLCSCECEQLAQQVSVCRPFRPTYELV